jgi:hypothetical protein
MSATATYGDLLKRYTPESLFENEFAKYSYIWANCSKDKSWRGGTYEIPILEAGFSSVQYGSLAADTDIGEMDVTLGTQTMKELWASYLVRESDLYRHASMEQSYLEIMPERVEEFMKWVQSLIGVGFLAGAKLSKATANGHATLGITVANPQIYRKGMKVSVDDDNSTEATGYVRTIDLNTGIIVIYDARSGGAVVDLSGYTTAQNAIVRIVGTGSEKFTSLPEYLLPAANGGSDTVYGKTRASYTALQSLVDTGAAWTAETILDDLLTTFYSFAEKRDTMKEILVPYGMFKNISKLLTTTNRASIESKKAGYGYNSVDIVGAEGQARIVALREMPKDLVYMGDVSKIKFAGAEPFKRKMYDSREFFMKRGTTGPEYISDMALRGDFIVKPADWGVVHSVPAAAAT